MAYFPAQIMPKKLVRETSNEVDGSPNIFNATDHNKHEREIISIEKFLVGAGAGTNTGLYGLISQCYNQFRDICNNGLIAQYNGSILTTGTNKTIPTPANILNTTTVGALATGATTITVVSTAGFPASGFITKFNDLTPTTPYIFGFGQLSDQEIIQYTGLTATTFTGCTRAVEGDAQAITSGSAVIFGGKASLSLSHKSWAGPSVSSPVPAASNVNRFITYHDASLSVFSALISNTVVDVSLAVEVQYSLNVVGSFNRIQA